MWHQFRRLHKDTPHNPANRTLCCFVKENRQPFLHRDIDFDMIASSGSGGLGTCSYGDSSTGKGRASKGGTGSTPGCIGGRYSKRRVKRVAFRNRSNARLKLERVKGCLGVRGSWGFKGSLHRFSCRCGCGIFRSLGGRSAPKRIVPGIRRPRIVPLRGL